MTKSNPNKISHLHLPLQNYENIRLLLPNQHLTSWLEHSFKFSQLLTEQYIKLLPAIICFERAIDNYTNNYNATHQYMYTIF